jgi:hypothetical protein
MLFLPFEKIKYKTNLSRDIIIEKLDSVIEPKKPGIFGGLSYVKYFRGELLENEFKIIRNIVYRNSFIPIIKGKIYNEDESVTINIFMRMYIFVTIFITFWLGICLMVICASLPSTKSTIIPSVIFVFGYTLMIACFKYESKKARKLLEELLNLEMVNKF